MRLISLVMIRLFVAIEARSQMEPVDIKVKINYALQQGKIESYTQ